MITTILQYSTINYKFLKISLDQLSKFSDEIIIPICDHFYNGELENEELLEYSFSIIEKYPMAKYFIFEWSGVNNNSAYYHNLSRHLGTLSSSNEWLLFVDTDEIVEDSFINWFNTIKYTDNTYWMTCYWYFREPIYQATKFESAGLLIRKRYCNWNINIRDERQQFFRINNFINGDTQLILSEEFKPFIHHYSWVLDEYSMINKVKNWGHLHDRDWIKLVKEEFSRPFNGTDFVHGYTYNVVENKFNINI